MFVGLLSNLLICLHLPAPVVTGMILLALSSYLSEMTVAEASLTSDPPEADLVWSGVHSPLIRSCSAVFKTLSKS